MRQALLVGIVSEKHQTKPLSFQGNLPSSGLSRGNISSNSEDHGFITSTAPSVPPDGS